jgi:3-hydroxybutyryl-CoA dehydrogenase
MKIGVLGAGSMGAGIAQVAATSNHNVVLYDNQANMLEKAKNNLTISLEKLVEKGKITAEKSALIQANIQYGSYLQDFAGCDLIIEAIIENMDIKKAVFQQLETIVSSSCMLASNTSSLSIASIAAACKHSSRVIGIHFFNPATLMPLVEIIPCIQTSNETLEKSRHLIDSWGKVTVLAKDTPGFIVNRVARPFYGEALRIYEEGIANFPTIDWAMTHLGGFKMGPFTLMDFIGNDINYTVTESVFTAFYFDPRYKPSFTQKRHAEAGWLGRKTGRGYYDYAEGAVTPKPMEDEELGKKILHRILVMLINEAADALFLNVASAKDIDLAMTKGVNYPIGLLAWADELGLETVVKALDQLYDEYREDRYRCSPLLRRMAKHGMKFFE